MAEIINLRLERKRKRRATGDAKAAENRVRHGQVKAEVMKSNLSRELDKARLDGHRRSDPCPSDTSD